MKTDALALHLQCKCNAQAKQIHIMHEKLPFFQFFPADWLADTRILTLRTKGAWIDLLCAMWSAPERGLLALSLPAYGRLLGADENVVTNIIEELKDSGIAEITTLSDGKIEIVSRRMVRDGHRLEADRNEISEKRRAAAKARWEKQKQCKSNASAMQKKCKSNAKAMQKQCYLEARSQKLEYTTSPRENDLHFCIEKIARSYPKQSHHRETREAIAAAIERHPSPPDEAAQAILTGTQAIAAKLLEWPKAELQTYCPTPPNFFSGDRWADDPKEFDSRMKTNNSETEHTPPPADLGGRKPSKTMDLRKNTKQYE